MEILKQFKDVYISDSSVISLPAKLEEQHKGLGGTNTKAAIKIQAVFSVISRSFKMIEILKATGNDSNKTTDLAANLLMLELIIFDYSTRCDGMMPSYYFGNLKSHFLGYNHGIMI